MTVISYRRLASPTMRSARRGFTLVEVLVAIVLVDIALLALVGGTSVLVRQATDLRSRAVALRAAANRIQRLGAGPCIAAAGTANGTGVIREEWALVLHANNTREVSDSVVFWSDQRAASIVLRTRLPC